MKIAKNALKLLVFLWFYTGRAEHSDDYVPLRDVKPPPSHGRHHRAKLPQTADTVTKGASLEGPNSSRGPIRPGDRKKRGKNKPPSSADANGGGSSGGHMRGSNAANMPHDMEATMNRYWQRAKQVLGVDTIEATPTSTSSSSSAAATTITTASSSSSSSSPSSPSSSSSSSSPSSSSLSSSSSTAPSDAANGITLPNKSLFAGFTPPDDANLWKIATEKAQNGEQVLLKKVLEVMKTPMDLFHSDAPEFKWASNAADIHVGKDNSKEDTRSFKVPLLDWQDPSRDPVVIFGTRIHQRMKFRKIEGAMTKWSPYGAMEMLRHINKLDKDEAVLPRRIVGIGAMDENWGWLSSHFVNRTVTWGFRFGGGDPFTSPYNEDEIKRFLDDPNLTMFMTNQHHNITNPKVISVPLGIMDVYDTWYFMHDTLKKGLTKKHLLFSAGSDFGARPYIRECVRQHIGEPAFFTFKRKEPKHVFNEALRASKMVLAMPGLGYDTYRLWEALAFGSVPVIERGFGLDRTIYKLPVLLVDDFYDLTKELLEQAYIEAIYRGLRNEWEYERMKPSWWLEILFNASVTGTSDLLMERHPVEGVVDTGFTRPLVPFDCNAMGGCGSGTKRTPDPTKSCSIYPRKSIDEWRRYKWNWFYD